MIQYIRIMHINHILLSLFFLIHVHYTIAVEYYSIVERAGHTATLYDNKIYFLGGEIGDGDLRRTNSFFYLDLRISFNTADQRSIPYFDISSTSSTLPKHTAGTTSVCGKNKDKIFLWNGDALADNSKLINYFDIEQQIWNTPNRIDGTLPIRRRRVQSVCDDNGIMYLYGGNVDKDMGLPLQVFNNTDTLDTVNFAWGSMSRINLPGPNNFYTATLLPSGDIVYLGGWRGFSDDDFVEFTNVSLYNVNRNTWSIMTTVGEIPPKRDGHAAVLTKDGRIIVTGGEHPNMKPADQPISVLDTTVTPFRWSIPKISTPNSFPFYQHTATLYGDYLIIAFGQAYDGVNPVRSKDIHILDVNNFKWVKSYVSNFPQTTQTPSPAKISPSKTNKPNVGAIVGIVIGSVVGIALIGVFSYKWYQKRREIRNAIPTAGSKTDIL